MQIDGNFEGGSLIVVHCLGWESNNANCLGGTLDSNHH